jgi:hypothetical protein
MGNLPYPELDKSVNAVCSLITKKAGKQLTVWLLKLQAGSLD